MNENIDLRELNDMVDVILVYGQGSITVKEETPYGKTERTLRAFQKKFPNIEDNLKKAVIEIFNNHKLDEVYAQILQKIPAADTLAKEYKNKPE